MQSASFLRKSANFSVYLAELEVKIKKYRKTASKYCSICKRFSVQLIDNYQADKYDLCYVNIKLKKLEELSTRKYEYMSGL